QVSLWLQNMNRNQLIPRYKEAAVGALREMAEGSGASGRDLSLLIEDMKEKESAYKTEAKSLQGVLTERLGLSLSSLSKEATNCLDVLVSSAMALETKDTSLTSFFCAINDMTSELYATEAKNKKMEAEVTKMRAKLTAALLLEERLKGDITKTEEHLDTEEVKADLREHNLDFLSRKSVDIDSRIRATEEQITATGLDQSLTHEALMNLSE
ncbi:HAUS augmin-like complex subunit 1, partial [Chaetura pelagica]